MISIIIPIYNGEKYIETFIKYMEAQTNKKFELIFIDDGSQDNSLRFLNKIKESSSLLIKIIVQDNQGVSKARNQGICNAEGDYLCFFDIDDGIECNYLEVMLVSLLEHKADLAICKYATVKKNIVYASRDTGKICSGNNLKYLRDFLYGKTRYACACVMVKREIIFNNNLLFSEGYKYGEDIHMLWRLIACSHKIVFVNKSMYLYYMQSGSAMSLFNERRLDAYQLIKSLENYFYIKVPEFYSEFKRYAGARVIWSLTWQAAAHLNKQEFKLFVEKNNVYQQIRTLLRFKNKKVMYSSWTFCFSKEIFRVIANSYGKKFMR